MKEIYHGLTNKNLTEALTGGSATLAPTIIANAKNYVVAEQCVLSVLSKAPGDEALLNAACQKFLDMYPGNQGGNHGYWVHSLSHFTEYLWNQGKFDWLQRFYQHALVGAMSSGDFNCSSRLADHFEELAPWHANPAAYGLTPQMVTALSNYVCEDVRKRILVGRFATEADSIRYQLRNPWRLAPKPDAWNHSEVDVEQIEVLIGRLAALNEDVSEFEGLPRRLCERHLQELEGLVDEHERGSLQERIVEAKLQLGIHAEA